MLSPTCGWLRAKEAGLTREDVVCIPSSICFRLLFRISHPVAIDDVLLYMRNEAPLKSICQLIETAGSAVNVESGIFFSLLTLYAIFVLYGSSCEQQEW